MVVVGSATAQGEHPLWLVIAGAAIGATLGDCLSYAIGRRWGLRFLERWSFTRRRLLPAARRAEPFFERRGGAAVFLGRWIGALRAVVPVAAGTARMPFPRFLAWNIAASIAWSAAAVGVGYAFGLPAARAVDQAGVWVYAALAAVVIAVLRDPSGAGHSTGSTVHGARRPRHYRRILMRFRLRPRRTEAPAAVPALRTERALVALAIHSQQLDERLARMEHRLDVLASDERDLDLPTQDDLLEVRLHSARVSAELTQVAVALQARIDDLAVQMPAVVAEDRRQRRARTLAETIIDLSDSLDTTPVDLDGEPGAWAATA